MSKSLLEQLPGIVAVGKRQAAQILEQLDVVTLDVVDEVRGVSG